MTPHIVQLKKNIFIFSPHKLYYLFILQHLFRVKFINRNSIMIIKIYTLNVESIERFFCIFMQHYLRKLFKVHGIQTIRREYKYTIYRPIERKLRKSHTLKHHIDDITN